MEAPALVFIGFMGAGKTSAARAAASAFGARAIDTDHEIERFTIQILNQRSDHFSQRGQRPDLLTKVHAPADADTEPSPLGTRRQLVHQARLADARLACDQRHG